MDIAQPVKIGKFKASKMIARESWNLLKQDKEMMFFPVFSAAVMLIIALIGGAIFFFNVLGGDIAALETYAAKDSGNLEIIFLFIIYFLSAFIVVFFQAGIVTIVNGRLKGQDLTFKDGFQNALKHIGEILLWSLVSASAGVILRAVAERSKILGRIVVFFLGTAWSILTFFIVPVLIIDDISMGESLKKSAAIIKKTWGESIIINIGVSVYFAFLGLLGVIVFAATLFSGNLIIIISGGVLLLIYLILLAIISETLSTIFKVVLYEYASTGVLPQGFSPETIRAAFRAK
ncbi:MAG: hypothetical protein UW30_C0015G0007 [Candidatus Giovannonibacteria bacterium GW2011_GWA2_44_13b]|uniref:Glycerophosphoryl diester phosphodiesterase membrane domain-containing protein n=2 Tax=Candidatus Giovannoniibacteriota TaxID=1752738 RepID=A0A0G1H0K8_9BACT|nr:MAG: hypothetical protein UW30_C0015G0007 [Candidatus Giovannonibacteria bacterium GW2011_GWA2_44_13b]OGF82445.1 MAG: hypothetical protein A2924_01150 [Candidatus Giovannonibacteria bacterium RIFCSPLOWO2_01_FULL_44_16]